MKKIMRQSRKWTSMFMLVLIVIAGFTSCNSDETSNPTIGFSFVGNTTTSTIPASRAAANSLAFNEGTIRLTRIQFETETDEADSVEVEIERLVEIDFATGATNPDLENLVFPVGTYSEVRVELELYDENETPSIFLEGTFTDANGDTHPVQFEFNSGETFEVEKAGQISIAEGSQVLAEITFDPVVWFAGVTSEDLSAATKTAEGVIVISETSNAALFDIVADGLDLATEVEIEM